MFKLSNSTIYFKNCTFKNKYGSSYSFEEVIEADATSKIIFDNKCLGSSTERNNYTPLNKGSIWFDTDLNKNVLWNGKIWVDNNANPANTIKEGVTDKRPKNVQIGFIYKDTTINKLIVWDGAAWVNMDGTELAQ